MESPSDRTFRTPLALTALIASVTFGVRPLFADPADPAGRPEAQGASSSGTAGRVDLEEMEIRGEIEKPKIFFILPKADRDVETRERRLKFYPDILEPLDKDRFEEEARVLYEHGIPAD